MLIDSEPLANRLTAEAMNALGIPMTAEESRALFLGMTWQQVMDWMEQRLGRPLPDRWMQDHESVEDAVFRQELRAVPGVLPAVKALHQEGIRYCLASQGRRERVLRCLSYAGFGALFDGLLFTAGDVARPKPAPDLFLHAARVLEVPSSACVVVEDTVIGVTAGVAAGMRVLAYSGSTAPAALSAAGGEVFDDMSELLNLIGLTQPA